MLAQRTFGIGLNIILLMRYVYRKILVQTVGINTWSLVNVEKGKARRTWPLTILIKVSWHHTTKMIQPVIISGAKKVIE